MFRVILEAILYVVMLTFASINFWHCVFGAGDTYTLLGFFVDTFLAFWFAWRLSVDWPLNMARKERKP